MMRRMLRGIRDRAEAVGSTRGPDGSITPASADGKSLMSIARARTQLPLYAASGPCFACEAMYRISSGRISMRGLSGVAAPSWLACLPKWPAAATGCSTVRIDDHAFDSAASLWATGRRHRPRLSGVASTRARLSYCRGTSTRGGDGNTSWLTVGAIGCAGRRRDVLPS
jgi:hypothetical protein